MVKNKLFDPKLAYRTFELIFVVYVSAWFVHYYENFMGTFNFVIPVVIIITWIITYFFLLFIKYLFNIIDKNLKTIKQKKQIFKKI